jgi:flagellar hook-length control protein FliK
MSALASMSPLASAVPMPQAAPQCSPADNGFARCLDQARDNNNNNNNSDDAAPADEAPQRPGTKKPPPNPRAERDAREPRTARAAGSGQTPQKPASETEAQTEAAKAETAHDDAGAPDLAAWLPGWAPPAAAAPAVAAAADDNVPLQASAAIGGAKTPATLPQDDPAARALAQLAVAPTSADKAAAIATAPGAELHAAASEQRSAAPDLQSTPLPTALPGTTTTTTLKAADAPPPTATLPSPIDSPAFAPTLATQVRWWASDGVQQAQLLLNPPEMGPVAVKILLEGREARIDFSADLAATRGAIEAALPVLAAALDEGGLKLSGGGVHDGSAQRQPEWNTRGAAPIMGAGGNTTNGRDTSAPAAAARSTTARGMVDLVA